MARFAALLFVAFFCNGLLEIAYCSNSQNLVVRLTNVVSPYPVRFLNYRLVHGKLYNFRNLDKNDNVDAQSLAVEVQPGDNEKVVLATCGVAFSLYGTKGHVDIDIGGQRLGTYSWNIPVIDPVENHVPISNVEGYALNITRQKHQADKDIIVTLAVVDIRKPGK